MMFLDQTIVPQVWFWRSEPHSLEAGKFLMRLANTRKPEHVIRQTDEIARLLRMKKIIVKNNLDKLVKSLL